MMENDARCSLAELICSTRQSSWWNSADFPVTLEPVRPPDVGQMGISMDGIRGSVHWLWLGYASTVGRFGWLDEVCR